MFRKITGLFLALLLLACASALAEESPWSYDSSNMILRRQAKLSGDVSIPSEVDGYPVHAIGGGALSGQHAITALTITGAISSMLTHWRRFRKSFWSKCSMLRLSISGVHLTGTNLYSTTHSNDSSTSPAGTYRNRIFDILFILVLSFIVPNLV